ncbi:MAG TPA: glutathione S-transferase family protein [Dongiaceae bacterium]|nr:glutathione S-transferase family protein [Dongiaceae bacterium]
MSLPTLYGAAYSVYVRAVRLALAEKGVEYKLVEVDIFGAVPDWYAKLHPFKRIPAFEHDGFRLYEAAAIMRYVDEAFPGPALMPPSGPNGDPRGRARVAQIMSLADAYLYRPLVWDIYVERCDAPGEGRAPDEAKIAAAIPRVATCFAAIEELMPQESKDAGPFLLGAQFTLADLHLAPMISIGVRAAEGAALLARHPRLAGWWAHMRQRPSLAATATRPEV